MLYNYSGYIVLMVYCVSHVYKVACGPETKSPWIENLGCFKVQIDQNVMTSLGNCQKYCMEKHDTTYFAFKKASTSCSCLERFKINDTDRAEECNYQIYQVLPYLNVTVSNDKGNCVITSCPTKTLKGSSCSKSYNIKTVCGSGTNHGTYMSQSDAFDICYEEGSYLPGKSLFPCNSLEPRAQGASKSTIWSGIFRVNYNQTNVFTGTTTFPRHTVSYVETKRPKRTQSVVTDRKTESPGMLSTTNVVNSVVTKTSSSSMILRPKTSSKHNEEKRKFTDGKIVGIVVGTVVSVIVIVIVVGLILKYRMRGNHRKNKTQTSILVYANAAGNYDIHDGQQANERDTKTTMHVMGEINGDQYAVVAKGKEVISEQKTNKGDIHQDGVIYYSPSVEYDALNYTFQKENSSKQSNYDVAFFDKNSEMTYHEAFSERPSSTNLEIYDYDKNM